MDGLISQLLNVEYNLILLEDQYSNLEQNILDIFKEEDKELQKGYSLLKDLDRKKLSEEDYLTVYNIEKHFFEKTNRVKCCKKYLQKRLVKKEGPHF